jgi:porin
LWICFGLLATSTPALAQDERPTGYPRSANERDGKPVEFSAVYTAELRANVNGGVEQGARYLDNLDLQVAVDAERVLGWRGARLFAYAIYNNGRSLSELAGDFQTISNIETGIRAARLFEAWIEQDLGGRGSLKAGLYNLNSEFDTTQSGGLFLLSSHGIGPDFSQSGRSGPRYFRRPRWRYAVRPRSTVIGSCGRQYSMGCRAIPIIPEEPRSSYPRKMVRFSWRN